MLFCLSFLSLLFSSFFLFLAVLLLGFTPVQAQMDTHRFPPFYGNPSDFL